VTQIAMHHIDVCDRRKQRSSGVRQCVLGEDVKFDKSALEASTSTKLEDIDVDLLVVIASVAYADRLVSRRRGTRWARHLSLTIPVYHPETWLRLEANLMRLLGDLSGDVWQIQFVARTKSNEMQQEVMPGHSKSFEGATVIPYSGGLDSFAALARLRLEKSDAPALLVHARRNARDEALPRPEGQATIGVPCRFRELKRAEQSYRTRTFVFFGLAALAWRKNSCYQIWIGESGIGCLGPALVPFGIEHPVYGSHPVFVDGLTSFLGALWGAAPAFVFPHLWLTKGAVVRELHEANQLAGWEATRSCSRGFRRQHPSAGGSHCGLCTGCMFRRVSLLAAGLGNETPGTYFEDVVSNADLSAHLKKSDREVGICAAIAMDELAACSTRGQAKATQIAELANAIRQPMDATVSAVESLLAFHRAEWSAFLGQLPARSWIRSVCNTSTGEVV
jgi:hypothetical protein